MNKIIVTVFNTEEKAFEGLTALKELHKNGDISVYATAVVNKNEVGKVKVKDISDRGPIGASVGALSGALIGLIAGPAGFFVGATAGMLGGALLDIDDAGVNTTFLEEVSKAIEEGKTAVVAEVEEGWTAPIDTKMNELDAMVFRRLKAEVAEEQFNRELEALNSEIEELEHDLEEANDEMKESIQKQIDKSKAKRATLKSAVEKKLTELKAETKAKTDTLNAQLKDAGQRRTKRIEKRKAKLNTNYLATKGKLEAANKKALAYIS